MAFLATSTIYVVCYCISGGSSIVGLRRRKKQHQQGFWIATQDLGSTPRNRFDEALNGILAGAEFDQITEDASAPYDEPEDTLGRPSIPPGVYFRMLLIGYFEGIESERGICRRCSNSLSLRAFLGLSLTDRVPDHSSLSCIRKWLPVSVYSTVFDLVLGIVAKRGLLQGRVAGIDTSVLRADASMQAIVRRESGEDYEEFITRLASEDAGRGRPSRHNKWRTGRGTGRGWLRKRAEVVERTFAQTHETGGGRRTRLWGLMNVQKRYSITVAAANLGVLLGKLLGRGTPR